MTSERDKIAAIMSELEIFIQEKEDKNKYVSRLSLSIR